VLGEGVDGISLLLEHVLKEAHLAFDALQALQQRGLLVATDVTVRHV